ncbi:MAG: lysine--tRNA ligase [Candidatus Pacebacteria bacterium]|nr:lysine--tRNA ligase [Candidatus Paceibacterota bacterium]
MLDTIIRERIKKLEQLKKEGLYPYPARVRRTHSIGDILGAFGALTRSKKTIITIGRVRSIRDQGKLLFVDIQDMSFRIQVILKRDELKSFSLLKTTLDTGDFIQVKGKTLVTKRGEKSLEAISCVIVSKSLRPLPTDFYGLEDIETRLRKRYLDLVLNQETKDLFVKKSAFWAAVRSFLQTHGFMEVETPVFELTPGGAEAEPFKTHHNALDEDFYLRISLEIALKKLMVGGFEKIYEIGRVFRNEGIDAEHLQDYTQLEFYWAYADYQELMAFVERMYKTIIKASFGTLKIKHQGVLIDWGKKWPTIDYCAVFKKNIGLDPVGATKEELYTKARALGIKVDTKLERGRLIDLLFKTVRPTLSQPCFLINPPVAIEPLAKRSDKNRDIVERFQVVACGTELGKGFSEANDPIDQRERFEEQMRLREKGDAEAQQLDEDFLEALEYGMPPTAGFGLSERLFSILADKPIRETVFFPPMKRKSCE